MAHDLPAERQVTDVVLADLQRELVRFGTREEFLGDGESVVDQLRRHAVIGNDEKPGVFAGAGNGTRQRRRRPRIAGEIRADIEHGNSAMCQWLGLGCCETHVREGYRMLMAMDTSERELQQYLFDLHDYPATPVNWVQPKSASREGGPTGLARVSGVKGSRSMLGDK